MAEEIQLKFSADAGGALAAVNALRQAVVGIAEPVKNLRSVFADASAAMRQSANDRQRAESASLAVFRANMQTMVATREISLQQAIGFDIQYTAQLAAEEQRRLEVQLDSNAASFSARMQTYQQLADLGTRYVARMAQEQKQLAEAGRREADRFAQPFRPALDEIGSGLRAAVTGLVEGTETARSAALQVVRSIESGAIGMIGSIISKAGAGPLAGLLGINAAPGEGIGDVLGNAVSKWVFGLPQQLSQGAATTANTAALVANTSAMTVLAGTLGAATATTGAEAIGAAGLAGAAGSGAGSSGFLGSLVGMLGFARGGVVPSAAGGWALPSFPGAVPALLHSREMVLPADISQGLQAMIGRGDGADGGAGGDAHFHAHFHGPTDAPTISRWFRDNLRQNAGALRDLFRSNALTPRSL